MTERQGPGQGEINEALKKEDRSMEQIPQRLIDEIEEAKDVQTGELGREPSPKELAADIPFARKQTGDVIQAGVKQYPPLRTPERVIARAEQFNEPESLEARQEALGVEDMADDPDNIPAERVDDELEKTFARSAEGVSPEKEAVRAQLPAAVEMALERLTEREREIIKMRFGIGSESGEQRTLEEAGEPFGLTREGARQVEAKALAKLRHQGFPVSLKSLLEGEEHS